MKNILRLLTLFLLFSFAKITAAQVYTNIGDVQTDERALYTMTKQMSQFISRFNYEEDQYGKKISPDSPDYRDRHKRKTVLPLLFDMENQRTNGSLRDFFISDLTEKDSNYFEFLGGKWYSEVSATFKWKGKSVDVSMIFAIEKENLGSKWVLTNVYFPEFNKLFPKGDIAEQQKHFLHPMSHELDFMNIHKVFKTPECVEYYASESYSTDYLTLFFYEIKNGNLVFEKVNSEKFHVFQIDKWYFEVSWFNREGYNTGWLISNLVFLKDNEKDELLKFYQPNLNK
ncbi:MAG: hypothetical protein IKV80_04180 [Bacteroidales bacterium]|nr:hypothetical protein [Bacteroidales bacterium]MBR5781765.1 hypothetical protein [Bacteroidales bacterium]